MNVPLTWPDTPMAYTTAPVGEATVFTFRTPAAGQTTISVGYGPSGSHMMRDFHLTGPGVDYRTSAQQVALTGWVGAAVMYGPVLGKLGYQPNSDYALTVSNPKPADARPTEMYYQMKPSSGG